tara:strand:+ start:814 stop:1596 length:783 start_codon:yes stop_codon:yes gene_type:complete
MKLYFAGITQTDYQVLKKLKVKNFLMSYYYVKNKWFFNEDDNVLLDSGGYTARMQGVEIDVKKYAEFINTHKIKLAFELDTQSKKETLYNREYLQKNTNTKIIPVYHLSDFENGDKKYLYNMLDEFDFISVGGVAGLKSGKNKEQVLYDFVFSNTRDKYKVHGLGITGNEPLKKYPWYSVDSTTWMAGRRFNEYNDFDEFGNCKRVVNFNKLKKDQVTITSFIHNQKTPEQKVEVSIRSFIKLEKYITRLWEKKGIKWDS